MLLRILKYLRRDYYHFSTITLICFRACVRPLQHAGVADQSTVAHNVCSKLRCRECVQEGQVFFPVFLKESEYLEIAL